MSPHGAIDADTLPHLIAAAHTLPTAVTHVTWDLHDIPFMDSAGLHLLHHRRHTCRQTARTLTASGLTEQSLDLLRLAEQLFPADNWHDFTPHTSPEDVF
ncbi:STAS domain-containing protein [Streptomyces sp. NPDC005227]|uniref:STAS domain-containing protein n=1 Tax=Streptomyces sp. NPDC005227 TaxID=3364707 RepID=UPI0036CC60AC